MVERKLWTEDQRGVSVPYERPPWVPRNRDERKFDKGFHDAQHAVGDWISKVPTKASALWHSYNYLDNPAWSMTKDAAKILPNAAYDAAKFAVDIGADIGQAGIASLPTWMGGEGLDMLSTDQKLRTSAWLDDKLGKFSWYDTESNPYANPELMEGYYGDAVDAASKHFFTHEDKGGFMNEKKAGQLWDAVEKKLPWAEWARENPNTPYEEFEKLEEQLFMAEFDKRYGDKWNEFVETDVDRTLMEEHGIGSDKGYLTSKIDFWDYGYEGNPLFKYSTPEAEDALGIAQIIPDIFMGTGLIKQGFRIPKWMKGMRGADEGIMDNVRRLEGPGGKSKYDWAEEWLRNRGAS